jgi:hypothetical protein
MLLSQDQIAEETQKMDAEPISIAVTQAAKKLSDLFARKNDVEPPY